MNQLNKEGKKHGPWEEFLTNGLIKRNSTYVNGIRNGLCEEYWKSLNARSIYELVKGERIGYGKNIYQDANLIITSFTL